MADHGQVRLHRLLKRREIAPLLESHERLLFGYRLTLIDTYGKLIAGIELDDPKGIDALLRHAQTGEIHNHKHELVQPIKVDGHTWGAIIAHVPMPGLEKANSQQRDILTCLAGTLSLLITKALETRDILDETVERYREINLLYQIGETIGTCLDPEEIPGLILSEARRCIQVDAGIVFLVPTASGGGSPDPVDFLLKARTGSDDLVKALQAASWGTIDQVTNTRQPAITTLEQPPESSKAAAVSMLCVPVQTGDRLQGVILLGRLASQEIFTAGEMKLLLALASQAAIALETVRLHLEEIQKQRLEEELNISRQIQHSLLPDRCPTAPGWGFAATYQAARQVGGDLFDFIHLPDKTREIGLVIADVAGKGIPAALFMAFCRTLIRMEARIEEKPAQVLKSANRAILQNSRSGLFLTAFYASLHLDTGALTYANGGHNPPYWYHSTSGDCRELYAKGYLLGLFNQIKTEEHRIIVNPGDILVFYTDGISEARNSQGGFFGEERLVDAILLHKNGSAQEVLDGIVQATNTFIGEAAQSDDFTLFVVKREKERF